MVGLVENGDLDRGQVRVSGTHVILQPTRAGDDDVDTGAQCSICGSGPTPPKTVTRAQVRRRGQRCQRRVDLGDQLASGGQDQRPRSRGARLVWLAASRATMGSRKA